MDHFWDFGMPALVFLSEFSYKHPINPCDLSVKQLMWTDEPGGENGGFVGV